MQLSHSDSKLVEQTNWDQSFPIPQDVKSEISHWLTVFNQWNGKEISPNSTTLETGDYSTFQSHVFSSYTRFRNFCTSNSLNPANITLESTDIVNDPFLKCIKRIMTAIHKLRPSYEKYQDIWDVNQVLKHLSTIKVIPKYTYTALFNKTLVLCKMFGLARSSDLVKLSFNILIITSDSIKGPVINAKEQRIQRY
ncbi:hypothetical protein ACTFIW_003382 [Dictyostelium discoideum]